MTIIHCKSISGLNTTSLNKLIEISGKELATKSELQAKVDQEEGKGLSTNDFTDEYKNIILNVIPKKPYYFNTVAEMKNSLLITVGSCAITLGYYEAGDGGSSIYYISSSDNGNGIELANDLYANTVGDKNVLNIKQLGFKENEDISPIFSLLKSNSTIILPTGTYKFLNTDTKSISNKENIKFIGEAGVTILLDTSINIYNIISSKNIIFENITFKDTNYNPVLFKKINMPQFSYTDTDANITVTVEGTKVSIQPTESAAKGTDYYIDYSIDVDPTKEYMLVTDDGFVLDGYVTPNTTIVRTFKDGTTQTDLFNIQCSGTGSAGQYRYLSNYIQKGVKNITIRLSAFKSWVVPNTDSFNYDLSKLRMYEAIEELPDSSDSFTTCLQKCEDIQFINCTFIGYKKVPITSLQVDGINNKRTKYLNCQYIDNYNNNIDVGNSEGQIVDKCKIRRNIKATNGDTVIYGKSSARGLAGRYADDLIITNTEVDGTFFGLEMWYVHNYNFSNNHVKNTLWGYSICQGSYGNVDNDSFDLLPFWRHGIEIATDAYGNCTNIRIAGKSIQGVGFSLTSNPTNHQINIRNVEMEQALVCVQYNNADTVNVDNLYCHDITAQEILDVTGNKKMPILRNIDVGYSTKKANSRGYSQKGLV